MAAYRSGIKTVIIPKENEKDLQEIDQTVRAGLKFVAAETIDTVLAEALVYPERVSREGYNMPFMEQAVDLRRPVVTR